MNRLRHTWVLLCMLAVALLFGCGDSSDETPATTVSRNFESGSIGTIEKISNTEWNLAVADDNGDSSLPASWRSWWSVKLENLDQNSPTKITLKNSGWPYYYLPVYSYDQKTWFQFAEAEVTQNANTELSLRKQFGQSAVWLARFYPYTFTDLQNYLQTLQKNQYIDIQIPGYTHIVTHKSLVGYASNTIASFNEESDELGSH